jgi:hypothetical protein
MTAVIDPLADCELRPHITDPADITDDGKHADVDWLLAPERTISAMLLGAVSISIVLLLTSLSIMIIPMVLTVVLLPILSPS